MAPLLALLLAAAQAAPLTEDHCLYMTNVDGQTQVVMPPKLRVLDQTRAQGPFAPDIPAGVTIMCARNSIVPAPDDWKVLASGHPLILTQGERIAILGIKEGRVFYALRKGALTEDEAAPVSARLGELQKHLLK